MKRIKVVAGVLNVSAGARISLKPAQASPRAHNLEKVKGEKGLFVALVPLQFKAGEVLGVDEVAKGQLEQVEILDAAADPAPV